MECSKRVGLGTVVRLFDECGERRALTNKVARPGPGTLKLNHICLYTAQNAILRHSQALKGALHVREACAPNIGIA